MHGNDVILNCLLKPNFLDDLSLQRVGSSDLTMYIKGNLNDTRFASDYFVFRGSQTHGETQSMLLDAASAYFGEDHSAYGKSAFTVLLLLTELAGCSVEFLTSKNQPTSRNVLLKSIESYIRTHSKDVTLDELASNFGYNKSYLSNMIGKESGFTFTEHLQNARIQNAGELLRTTDISIEEIIARVGYCNRSHFYRCFKKKHEMTPVEFRRQQIARA